tara:strand:- start:1234 stop:2499 length:1266 start_codon:yes stop_codon:yes gene_type:complete
MQIDPSTSKYTIKATIRANGVVDRSDVVGAIFGQTEGLLGDEMDLRDLQKSGRMGRVEVNVTSDKGKSKGEIEIPSSMDQVETAVFAASLETVDRVGPCKATIKVHALEDTRVSKRDVIVDRARELFSNLVTDARSAGSTITDSVRQLVQTEEIILYGREKLPAGPNIESSDAIILVEGRSDVLNLLRHGIKNSISVEGTNIPSTICKLSKERTVTAFVDGDRGGQMILQELLQVAELDFIAQAPEKLEVEHLTHKHVMKCLRDKTSTELFVDQNKWARSKSTLKKNIKKSTMKKEDSKKSTMKKEDSKKVKKEVTEKPTVKKSSPDSPYLSKLDNVKGSKKATIFGDGFEVMNEMPITGLQDVLKSGTISEANCLIMDGIITQRLVDLVEGSSIKVIVAEKKGPLTSEPTSIELLTRKDL